MTFQTLYPYVTFALFLGLCFFLMRKWKHRTLETMLLLPGEAVTHAAIPVSFSVEPRPAPGSTRAIHFYAGLQPGVMRVTNRRLVVAAKGFGGKHEIRFVLYRDAIPAEAGSLVDTGIASCAVYASGVTRTEKDGKTRFEFALTDGSALLRTWLETDQPALVLGLLGDEARAG